MSISLHKMFYKNFVAFLGVGIVIGNGWFCVQGAVNDEASYEENNELFVPLDPSSGKSAEHPQYLNVSQHPGELCNRPCVCGQRRLCYFHFTLEFFQTLGVPCGKCAQGVQEDCNNPQCIVGDGVEKGVMSINRQVPGPAIQVCKGDQIIVDVQNNAAGTTAALHWHGLHMVKTPHMDGVPFLTQCPIPFPNSFRYQFEATQEGTQFYHAHSGLHKADGHYGALIVRQCKDPAAVLYDHDSPDHIILVSDSMHTPAVQLFPGLRNSSGINPSALLVNGRGVYTNPRTKERTVVPPTRYYVTPGKRYRFRSINAASHACPLQLQIQGHEFSVISSDSFDVEPHKCDTLVINSGERYDFVINANHSSGDFWIRIRALGLCARLPLESYALIRYKPIDNVSGEENSQLPELPNYDEQYPFGSILNHPNADCWAGDNSHCVTELISAKKDESLRYTKPDHIFYLSFQNLLTPNKEIFEENKYMHFLNPSSNLTLVGIINNITFAFPDSPPLTQPKPTYQSQFCDSSNRPEKCYDRRICPCVHRLKVGLNSIVALVLVDENPANTPHPIHLHGYAFNVVGMGTHPSGAPMTISLAKEMAKSGALQGNVFNHSSPKKDTVSVPPGGYVHLLFKATNPGFWLMHCHFEWHFAVGMGLVLEVGDRSNMVKPPKDFPKCGSYLPPVNRYNF